MRGHIFGHIALIKVKLGTIGGSVSLIRVLRQISQVSVGSCSASVVTAEIVVKLLRRWLISDHCICSGATRSPLARPLIAVSKDKCASVLDQTLANR